MPKFQRRWLRGLHSNCSTNPKVTNRYRIGDVRHCFADISHAHLGYAPHVTLDDGVRELATWLADQTATDRVAKSSRELAARGLTV